jgi:hypothetical protein
MRKVAVTRKKMRVKSGQRRTKIERMRKTIKRTRRTRPMNPSQPP